MRQRVESNGSLETTVRNLHFVLKATGSKEVIFLIKHFSLRENSHINSLIKHFILREKCTFICTHKK